MTSPIPESTRARLARSLPSLLARRDLLAEAMEARLRAEEGRDEAFGQAELTATILVELLLDQARQAAATGRLGDLAATIAEHEALDIRGRHYSRFGDGLVAILADLLGPNLPRDIAAAWGDFFWAVIREAMESRETAPA